MDVSNATTIYAAVLSSVTAGWTIFREITKNKPRIQIEAMFGDLQMESDTSQLTGIRWIIRITNIGQVAIVLSHIAYMGKENKQIYVLFPLKNKEFKPCESIHYGPGPERSEVDMLWVEDTSGRRYKAKRFIPTSGKVLTL